MNPAEAHPLLAAAMTPADLGRHACEVAAAIGLTVQAEGGTLTFTGPHGTLTRHLRAEGDGPAPSTWRPSDALTGLLARELRPISRLATWHAATYPASRTHAARDDGQGTLCGHVSGNRPLSVHGALFAPDGRYEVRGREVRASTCRDCAGLYTALYAPLAGPWRVCEGCGKGRHGNYFPRDLRQPDGKSKVCTLCWDRRRRVREEAQVIAA